MSPSPDQYAFDPSHDPADQGGMSLASGASGTGDPGPVSSFDPSLGSGGGGMSSSAAASVPGNEGPNATIGPDDYERGYAQGQHDRAVLDRETLPPENPVYDVLKGFATGGRSFVHEAVDAVSDYISEAVRQSTVGPDKPADDPDYDPYAGTPDATVHGDAGSSDAGFDPSRGSDPNQSPEPSYSFDPSQSYDPSQGYDAGQQGYDPGQQGYDPSQGYDAGQQGFDAGQQGFDAGQQGYDAGQQGFDPGQQGFGAGQQGL